MKRSLLAGLVLVVAATFAYAEDPKEETIKGKVVGVSTFEMYRENGLEERGRGYTIVLKTEKGIECAYAAQWGAYNREKDYWDAFMRVDQNVGKSLAFIDYALRSGEQVTIEGPGRNQAGCLAIRELFVGTFPAEDSKQTNKLPTEQPSQKTQTKR